MNKKTLAGLAAVLATSILNANESIPVSAAEQCREGPIEQFGRYIGDWDIHDLRLDPQSGEWVEAPGSRWNFVCLGNGTAVQDFWMPEGGQVGTNLRTWNSATESWDIAWAVDGLPGFAHISATQNDRGEIVMRYVQPVPDPLRRITFFPPDDEGWDWKLEVSSDQGNTWIEVYRIRATPVAATPSDNS